MGSKEKIGMLESLLARIRTRAAEPRPVALVEVEAAPAVAPVTAPPPPEAAVALRQASSPEIAAVVPPVAEAPPPMESRARLVNAEERIAPPEEVVELDDRHIVQDDAEVSVSVVEEEIAEAELLGESAEVEKAPPSSKRPITEPLAEPEPVEAPKHTPPPESGKQVAALSFDDDFTGVREANKAQPPIEAELPSAGSESIPLASQRPPVAAAKHEMEADLPSGTQTAPGQFSPDLAPPSAKPASKPPSVRLPSERPPPALAMEPEVVKPVLAMTAAPVFEGSVAPFKPTTFAELLDASLSL